MKYDVFISYSSRNHDVANAICHVLEENMLKCWMAPRDIPVGSKYASVIKDAIVASKVFVLVFSEYAAVSPWVESELNIAFSNRKTIIPYKVDKAFVEDYDEFYVRLNNRHWIDSFPDFHERFNELIQVVSANVFVKSPVHTSQKPLTPKPVEPKPVERTWKVGDYYDVDGKKGVVFWVDASGKHGKIVSLDQAEHWWHHSFDEYRKRKGLTGVAVNMLDGSKNMESIMKIGDWRSEYPAFAWCANHGDGWYLPAIEELKAILVSDKVCATMKRMGKARLHSKGSNEWYWSSTQYNEWCALAVSMNDGNTYDFKRSYVGHVRAVSAF